MKNRRGEIATILTIGTLVIIGATAIVSSLGIKNKQSTSSRASGCAAGVIVGSGPYYTCQANCGKSDSGKCYAYSHSSKDSTCAPCNSLPTNTPIPTLTVAPTQAGCKTPPMICTDPVGTQGACCKGYTCYGAGPGFPSRCTAPANTPIPSTTPNPLSSCSKGGQPTIGTQGYSKETCESICGAQNGTYVGPNQQWQEGTQRGCCCTAGNSNTNASCPQPGLGYACCVIDDRCPNGEQRYRWYGCTGQVCSATKINTSGGYKNLVDCPYGVDKNTNQETGVCSGSLTPPSLPSVDCKDYSSWGLLGGCREKCTTGEYECIASPSDASGEKRFCCPVAPTVDPNAPSERDAPCVAAYGATSYCSTSFACNGDDEYGPDGGSVVCSDTASAAMNQRCCKPKGVSTAKCVKHGCKDMSSSFSTLKSYYQKGDTYYSSSACTDASAYASLEAVTMYCSEGVTAPFDNDCREALGDPQAQCVLNPIGFIVGGDYEKTDIKCGPFKLRYCYKKKAGMNYISRKCNSINPDYDTTKSVYEKDGRYYHKDGSNYVEYTSDELLVYCSTSIKTPFDNVCIKALNDPTAQCVLNPLGWVAGGGYEKTGERCGPLNSRYCYIKKATTPLPDAGEGDPIFETPTDMVGTCIKTITDDTGTYCVTLGTDGQYISVPMAPNVV